MFHLFFYIGKFETTNTGRWCPEHCLTSRIFLKSQSFENYDQPFFCIRQPRRPQSLCIRLARKFFLWRCQRKKRRNLHSISSLTKESTTVRQMISHLTGNNIQLRLLVWIRGHSNNTWHFSAYFIDLIPPLLCHLVTLARTPMCDMTFFILKCKLF